jgi:hypothetical protein
MRLTTIRRLGFKADSALFRAKALVTSAGEQNVTIILRGEWKTTQGCTKVFTPCQAKLGWDGTGFGIEGGQKLVSPGPGATVDIVAKVAREEDGLGVIMRTTFLVRFTAVGARHLSWEERIERPVTNAAIVKAVKRKKALVSKGVDAESTSDYGGIITAGGRGVGDYLIVPGTEE